MEKRKVVSKRKKKKWFMLFYEISNSENATNLRNSKFVVKLRKLLKKASLVFDEYNFIENLT